MSWQADARPRTTGTVLLPAPTVWPIVLAFGVTLIAAGMVTNAAVSVLGPTSDLLDTRGICYLAQGDTKRAIDDLRAAIIDAPSDVKYIHLAMAEVKSGDKAAAAKSLEKARSLDFDVNSLSAKERENYRRLLQQVEGKS